METKRHPRNSKERRAIREAFVTEYNSKIGQLLVNDQHTLIGDADSIHDFVTEVARPGCSYGPGTSWLTIWYTLRNDYNRLNKTDF